MLDPVFAVIDLETTGLFSRRNHRIVEIAIVSTDRTGKVIDRWETLINPERDLGPQHIHQIRAADIHDAPKFAQIVPEIISRIRGKVLVAHNASFDQEFLKSEFDRAGHVIYSGLSFVCTMRMAKIFLPGAGRSLKDCCDALDIEIKNAHRAMDDAFATAQLLETYISSSNQEFWHPHILAAQQSVWPENTQSSKEKVAVKVRPESPATEIVADDFLQKIMERLPEYAGEDQFMDYLAKLDQVLIDRHISATEAQGLVEFAEDQGMSKNSVIRLHHDYYFAVLNQALADQIITEKEELDLKRVATLLSISDFETQNMLSEALSNLEKLKTNVEALPKVGINSFQLQKDDLVVLTGEMSNSRSQIEERMLSLGLKPWSGVTKKVKLLVAADPDSLSGKARKANDYGIPIVTEAALYELLDQMTQ